jgi:hypothetical protein
MYIIYEVVQDTEDGMCHPQRIAFIARKEDALKMAKGRGPMGCSDSNIIEHTVYSNLDDYNKNSPEALRKSALAKLTQEEKKALGIWDT